MKAAVFHKPGGICYDIVESPGSNKTQTSF